MTKIKEAIERIMKDQIPDQVVVGKVLSVATDKQTCDVEVHESHDRLNVRLQAVEDEDVVGQLVVPKDGSWVLVGLVNNDPSLTFIVMFSEVEEVWLHGHQYGGLIKVEDLVSKMNRLEDKVNDLVEKNNTHTHITTATPGTSIVPGVISPTTSQETPIPQNTTVQDIENDKVKHG